MTNIQLGSGSSSSKTHRLTQSSQTLNRRYVERPSNLAIEEAAKSVHSTPSNHTSSHPSRLVNLRVRATDLAQLQEQGAEPEHTQSSYMPKVVEYGSADVPNLDQIVPPEETVEECYAPSSTTNEVALVRSESTVAYAAPAENYDPQALAMNIAADYAAASIGTSGTEQVESTANSSIDTIARAASDAIAAIRTASDPEEIAEQVVALQDFAKNLRENSNTPEMAELSSTIETFVGVAMKSSRVQEELEKRANAEKIAAQAQALPVTTKKKLTAKPATKIASAKAIAAKKPATIKKPAMRTNAAAKPMTKPVRPAVRRSAKVAPTLVADEDQALRKALRSVAAIDDDDELPMKKRTSKRRGGGKRLALAFFCAVVCVGLIVYFVGSNIPDISVKVAAMQTGIEASYPSYIPRDFSLRDISSEDGKITLSFAGPERAEFTITEEKSSWDSNTLLRNYIEPNWQDNYTTTHEQGITIYMSGSNAAWVNGGVMYKITASGNTLTKKQLRNIVTSMQ